ncbi:endonuclease/exonuclease/phosphatase family protein [Corallibacter vietnamensis]|uniref:Endonuclease/exonuclease/phosphatase family protein n=1 Tax=Corallibacter vietnamensis TaxID=904130 RepID=A0ABP7GXW3_9FLAO
MKHLKLLSALLFVFLISCNPNSKRAANLVNQKNSLVNTTRIQDSKSQSNPKANIKNSNALTIASWNIRDLGKTKNDQEILQIAKIIRDYDIVALQEVVAKDPGGAKAVAKIADELNRMGSKWDYRISDPTKSPSVYISERYAFLWKTSKVKLTSRAFLDSELEDKCFREPYIGKFQLKNGDEPFYVINFHSRKFNDNPEQEIIFFKDYPKRLKSDRVLIVGDFNLNENHEVWDHLYYIGFKSALKNTKTTLKTKCKKKNYLNYSIDNIYFPSSNIEMLKSGSNDFVNDCYNLQSARLLSDHLPVYMEFLVN